jgi:hypothetical protein
MHVLALAAFLVALLLASYGLCLVATPDYDGGRRPVGAIVLAFAILVVLASAAALRRGRS